MANGDVGQRVRVPKMAELVASELRRQIVRGELAEDDALPTEAALMEQFGVSRPTLREAFRVLEAESLITIRRGARGGARVQTPKRDVAARYAGLILEHQGTTLKDVYDARMDLEAPSVRELAQRRDPGDVAALRDALSEYEAVADDPTKALQLHNEFHGLVVRLVGNQTRVLLNDIVEQIIHRANCKLPEVSSPTHERAARKTFRAHRLLVELIEKGEVDEAEDLWRRHLVEAEKYLVRDDSSTVLDLLE